MIQTGEFDYAWNVQVEDEILKTPRGRRQGQGRDHAGGNIEFIQLNQADPWTEVDGERAKPKSRHPIFSDPAVRQAMVLLVDRKGVQDFIYGRTGVAPATSSTTRRRSAARTRSGSSTSTRPTPCSSAGWKGADCVREKAARS